MDRFLSALPHNMKRAVSLCKPQTVEDPLEAMEAHQNTEALLKGSRVDSGNRVRGRPTADDRRGIETKGGV
jgi:hypothetical protein